MGKFKIIIGDTEVSGCDSLEYTGNPGMILLSEEDFDLMRNHILKQHDKIESAKELLIKYIKHLHDVEGSDFTDKLNQCMSDVKFSHDEVKALIDASWNSKYSPNYK